jgi:hypothetical protein
MILSTEPELIGYNPTEWTLIGYIDEQGYIYTELVDVNMTALYDPAPLTHLELEALRHKLNGQRLDAVNISP